MSDGSVRYRILGVLGEGGFGKVYRARMETDEGFTKEVAVKVLHDQAPQKSLLKRFRDEARILGLLKDRAIVGVEPPIRLDGRWAVVMDFVDGLSCDVLARRGDMPAGVAVEIVGEVARALHNAYHQRGPDGKPLQLLHRDIKPDNIQVTPSGDVMLLDFGIARANFANREYKTRQAFGGTPGYIAPERLQAIEDPRGDVFSLGVVLHELVSGERPKFSTPTIVLEDGKPTYEPEDLELNTQTEDPLRHEVFELAGWMRAFDYETRPTARQVEDACRTLRTKLPPPYLREWAEAGVPSRDEMDTDERTGRLLTLLPMTALDPTPRPLPPSRRPPLPATIPPPNKSIALGAVLGGGTVVLAGMIAFAMVLVGIIGWGVLQLTQPSVTPLPPQPEPSPVQAPVPTPEAAPAPEPRPTPQITPTPAPTPTPPREIRLPGTSPAPEPAPAPISGPPPAPVRRTGTVVVQTVPSGSTVKQRGVTLEKIGPGYRLSPGTHILEIVSPRGERTTIPVQVRPDERVDICYSFDSNARCGQ